MASKDPRICSPLLFLGAYTILSSVRSGSTAVYRRHRSKSDHAEKTKNTNETSEAYALLFLLSECFTLDLKMRHFSYPMRHATLFVAFATVGCASKGRHVFRCNNLPTHLCEAALNGHLES